MKKQKLKFESIFYGDGRVAGLVREDVDSLADTTDPSVILMRQELSEAVEGELQDLRGGEQELVRLHFGFDGERMSLQCIASDSNVTKQTIFGKKQSVLLKLSRSTKLKEYKT